jgi:hypothetical protein
MREGYARRRPSSGIMIDGARVAKLLLIVGGLVWLAAWVSAGTPGLAPLWLGLSALGLLAYGALGWFSYRGPRARYAAATMSALLTVAILFASFAHLGLLVGGIAIAAGCLVPTRR